MRAGLGPLTGEAAVKVLLHDYGGHPFTMQLGRALARRGTQVVYSWFSGFSCPKGDPSGHDERFSPRPLTLGRPFDKDNLLRRAAQQLQYAPLIARLIRAERPDAVLSASAPIEVQAAMLRAARQCGAGFVYWLQDIHSEAIGSIVGRSNAWLGKEAGEAYRRWERRLLRDSDAVIAIAESFRQVLAGPDWRLDVSHVEVIPNWAPLEALPRLPRDNDWAARYLPPSRVRLIYAGTLARKHDPDLLLALATRLDADLHVFSEGSAATALQQQALANGLGNLIVRPWLPLAELPAALGAADLLLAILRQEAGRFSVPSKILSYLAAGRPILAAMPAENLASRTIAEAGAGLVVAPDDIDGLVAAARTLLGDAARRRQMGDNGRRHAERHFDIDRIAARFETILLAASAAGLRQAAE